MGYLSMGLLVANATATSRLCHFLMRVYHLNKNVLNQPCKMPVCKTVSKCRFNTCRAFVLFGIAVWVATQRIKLTKWLN